MNVLIHGDSESCAPLRHEVPLAIGDAFLYVEAGERRAVLTNVLEDERISAAAPELERLLDNDLGRDELIAGGHRRAEVHVQLCLRAVAALGITEATVPDAFPLALADRLRAAGVTLTADESVFDARRRQKTDAEIAGIRRASASAVAGLTAAAELLRAADIRGDELWSDGERLTAETVRARIREVCARAGAPAPSDLMVVAEGPGPSSGHDPGHGPLPAHIPITIDLWPRDERSGCHSDMTRTFLRGTIPQPIAEIHELVLDAHRQALAAVTPGVTGAALYAIACDVFEAAGHPTSRSKRPGDVLREGFYFALGHGVGLDVHEAPDLGRTSTDAMQPGDVIAIEPGTKRLDVGGTRVEDLLLVTTGGHENLTGSFPHGLAL